MSLEMTQNFDFLLLLLRKIPISQAMISWSKTNNKLNILECWIYYEEAETNCGTDTQDLIIFFFNQPPIKSIIVSAGHEH